MTEAFIYDAIRSPRGKGRPDGALHEVTSVALSAQMLDAIRTRNGLEGHAVEDVIWGNVTQVGDSEIAKLEEKGYVAFGQVAFVLAVIGGEAGGEDILHFVLARPAQHLGFACDALGGVVAGAVVADRHNVGA